MTIKFQISETANFWHFVSNLVSWHDSVRLYYRDYWLDQTGDFTEIEEKCLEKLKDFFKKYTYGENYWGKVFLLGNNNVWEKAGQKFTASEIELLKEASEVFYRRFRKIWDIDQHLLKVWKIRLEKTSKRFVTESLIQDLDVFFNYKQPLKSVTVFLLMCEKRNDPAGGGANLGKGYLTLEVSRADYDAIRPAWLLFWHELTHNLWQEDSSTYQQLRRDFSDQMKNEGLDGKILQIPTSRIINEVVVDSLFPKGYLAKKHFDFPVELIFNRFGEGSKKRFKVEDWHYYFAYTLKDLAKDYIENGKAIDMDF